MRERGDGVRALHQARVLEQRDAPVSVPRSEEVAALLRSTVAGSTVPPLPVSGLARGLGPRPLHGPPETARPRRPLDVPELGGELERGAVPRAKYMCSCPPSAPPLRRHSDVRARCQEDNRASLDLQAALPFTLGG